jgi:hypothetical protein
MDITVILKRRLSSRPRSAGAAAPAVSSLDAILRKYDATLVPLHPGVEASPLALHYALRVPAGVDTARLLAELREHEAVDAAYVKPSGEAPA